MLCVLAQHLSPNILEANCPFVSVRKETVVNNAIYKFCWFPVSVLYVRGRLEIAETCHSVALPAAQSIHAGNSMMIADRSLPFRIRRALNLEDFICC